MPFPQAQLVPLIFEGLDTFTDPRRGVATKLDLLENLYVSTPFKLQKRNGFTSQSKSIVGGGSVSAGAKLAALKNESVMGDGLLLYTRDSVTGSLVKRSKVPSGSVTMERITGDNVVGSAKLNSGGAYAAGIVVYAWQLGGTQSCFWRAYDNTTGAVVGSGTFTGRDLQVRAVGGLIFIVSYETAGTTLNVRKLDPASPSTLGAPTTIVTSANLTQFAVAGDTGTPQLIVAYNDSGALTTMHVKTVSTALAVSADTPFTEVGATGTTAIAWLWHDYSNGSAYITVNWNTNGCRVYDINTGTRAMSNATNVAAAASVDALTGGFTGTTRLVVRQVRGASADLTVLSAWSQGSTFELCRSVVLSSNMFMQGNRFYVAVSFEDTTSGNVPQRHRFLVEYEPGTAGANGGTSFVAYISAKDDGGSNAGQGVIGQASVLADAVSFGASSWGLPYHYSFDQGVNYGLCAPRVTFTETNVGPPHQFADVLFVPGMQLNVYDGNCAVEHGFYLRPQRPSLTGVGGGSKSGTYSVKIVYRWTDARGRIWRSEVSPSNTVSLGANTAIQVLVPTLRITNKAAKFNLATPGEVVIEAYCTTAADATTFYLDSTATNTVTADTVTFTLTQSDASLATRELLYQTGGVLENATPPAVRLVRSFQGRLFTCAYQGDVWHSKDLAEGEGVAFSNRFRIPLDTSAGIITALMDMDDTFMMGQRNGIYRLGGGDPTDTGQNLFATPTRINTTIGPVDQVSVVRLPAGLAYNSPRGIHLMTRGLDSQFIGDKVQRYTLADTITGAVALDSRNHAAWTTSNGDLLIYDYNIAQWYVWTGLAAVACSLYQNNLAILASDGTVKVETPGTFNDDGTAIVSKLRTAWLQLANIGGYQRLWDVLAVGEYKGAHNLQFGFEYNHSAFTNETVAAVAGSRTYNTTIEGGYVWEAQPKQQLCTAVRITVQDVMSNPGSEGFYLSGMALNVGVYPSGVRVASDQGLA